MSIHEVLQQNKTHIDEMIKLQSLLWNITKNNLMQTRVTIVQSKYMKSKEDMRFFLKTLISAFDCRPLLIECFNSILSLASKHIPQFLNSKELNNLTSQCNYIRLKFYELKLIDINCIIESAKKDDNTFIYFAPEIKEAMPAAFEKHVKGSLLIQENLPSDFTLHKQNRENGYNNNPISIALRNDDVSSLTALINTNNLNDTISSSIYETCSFLRLLSPRVIELAAFFGSFNSFEYLLNQGAELRPLITQFAAIGGNTKIVSLLESKGFKFNNCLDIAIEFNRKEICDLILKKTSFSVESIKVSIQSNNIEYFVLSLPKLNNINEHIDKFQRTILHYAAQYSRLDLVKILTQINGININALDIVCNLFLILFIFIINGVLTYF